MPAVFHLVLATHDMLSTDCLNVIYLALEFAVSNYSVRSAATVLCIQLYTQFNSMYMSGRCTCAVSHVHMCCDCHVLSCSLCCALDVR